MKKTAAVGAVLVALIYLLAIMFGMRAGDLFAGLGSTQGRAELDWAPLQSASIPNDAAGNLIRRGALIFNETPVYAEQFTHARISCSSCHAEGGIQPYASPMVGVAALFPMYNERAGRVISLKDRIQECFVRSENGEPLDDRGPEMQALVAYIDWLSQPQPNRRRFIGRGLEHLPELKPDPVHGREVYSGQCAGCHGANGQGIAPAFPPLWGSGSFNDGAGMDKVSRMAAFVQHNMPQNRMGILSPQDAWDVAAFIHTQPRPVMNADYKHF